MQSKTSFFNPTLFRKNLSRYWPLWGFASFVGFLIPAAVLVQMVQQGDMRIAPLVVREGYYALLGYVVPIVSLCYAILCAMTVWNYLYNARSVGLMHSLPIRREGLFLTNLLSGLAMMLIPYAVAGVFSTLLFACCGGFDAWGTLVTILGIIGESLTFFGIATFCAFLTGNLFALPALYFLLNFLAPLGDWLCNLFAQGFLFGFASQYSGSVEFLCPVVYLYRNLYYHVEYARDSVTGFETTLSVVTLEGGWLIALYAAAGLVFLGLSYLLYRRRQSERAGDVVAIRAFRPVFRFGVAALCALLGGRLLYALLWESFQSGDGFAPVPMAIFLMVAGLIGYYGASMLLSKSLRVFRGSAVGALCLVVACAAFCAGMHFDLFGAERRIPADSEIHQLELYVAGNTYYLSPEDNAQLLSEARMLQETLIAQKERIRQDYADYTDGISSAGHEPSFCGRIHYTYTLKSGGTVERSYNVSFTPSRMAEAESYAHALDAFINSAGMRQARLRWGDPDFKVEGGWFSAQYTGGFDLGTRECETLLSAIARDAGNGAWGRYDWFEDGETAYAMDLSFSFVRTLTDERGTQYESYDSISIAVRPEMAETKQALLDLGLVGEEDFITWAELKEDSITRAELKEEATPETAA